MDSGTTIISGAIALIIIMLAIGVFVGFCLWMYILLGVGKILIMTAGIGAKPEPEEVEKPNTYLRMSQEP